MTTLAFPSPFRPAALLGGALATLLLVATLFVAWSGYAERHAAAYAQPLVEPPSEVVPPPGSPPHVRSDEAAIRTEATRRGVTLSIPDVVPAQIPAPGEVAFKAGDVTGGRNEAAALRIGGAAVGAAPAFGFAGPDREGYAHVVENEFLAARHNPLSTFGIDVDRASYANVRRFIGQGIRPPVDAVRIEELVNYFPYRYPPPTDERPFAVHTEIAAAPWAPAHRLVKIGIQGRPVALAGMPAANLVFLIDVSGSMQSPDKLPLVKSSLGLLVDQLRPQDRVALVVYAGAAGLVLEPTAGSDKPRIRDAIDRLEAGGSTAGGAGLQLAYDVAARAHVAGGNNRVILATDGDFNVGPSSDAEMVRLIEERRGQGTFLTVLGFGTGNLQDAKMEQIADHGNGNFAYIDGIAEARKVLVHELGGTLLTIAKDVKVQVEFNPARVAGYRLIGYENRRMAAEDFADDRKDGGELGAGHSVTALYEVVPVGAESTVELRAPGGLRYQAPAEAAGAAPGDELLFVQLRYQDPDGARSSLITHPVRDAVAERPSSDLRFAAAVAAFGMLLRDSPHAGAFGMGDVLALARAGMGEDEGGFRAGFLELVERARGLELLAGR